MEQTLVRLSESQLDQLDLDLAIAESKLNPGAMLKVRGPAGEESREVPGREDLAEVRSDIKKTLREGVHIARSARSYPLIPLFRQNKVELPAELRVLHTEMHYDFYLVNVTFSCLLEKDQFPLKAELALNLNDDVQDPARHTRPIRIFPDRKDRVLFSVDVEGSVELDAEMNIGIPPVGLPHIAAAEASADAHLKGKIVWGPYSIQLRKAAIEVTGINDPTIQWRYDLASELAGHNDFNSFLILMVPREAASLQISAQLGVVPCKRTWWVLRSVLPPLSDRTDLPVEIVRSAR